FVDHKLKLTYDDLKEIPEDDAYRHEIIDGMHVASPSPITRHQYVSKRLQYQLYTMIELAGLGEMFAAPMDVELGRYDVFEPDLLVILNDNAQIIEESHIRGVPDLVVEILSPSTASRDRGIKRDRYEKAGTCCNPRSGRAMLCRWSRRPSSNRQLPLHWRVFPVSPSRFSLVRP
ncbi:MAG: Uma2 family endonuclease, partial [Spirochaetaceae bacterium]|nr:Uma2 family endonuclease [Spirochaetaceae bacterium]